MTLEKAIAAEFEKARREATQNMTRDEHDKSFKNFDMVKQSKICGCFYCKKIFNASKVTDFVTERDGKKTALCPYCGIDSVIQDANVEISHELLNKMNREWFGD